MGPTRPASFLCQGVPCKMSGIPDSDVHLCGEVVLKGSTSSRSYQALIQVPECTGYIIFSEGLILLRYFDSWFSEESVL